MHPIHNWNGLPTSSLASSTPATLVNVVATGAASNELAGSGKLFATPRGRIRIEANQATGSLIREPDSADLVRVGNTPQIWPNADGPVARIVKVGSADAPADPRGRIDTGADVGLQTKSAVDVLIETRNFPVTGKVLLRL